MSKQNILEGDRLEELDFCDHFVLEKSLRLKFETGKHISSKSFKYAHAYLWGPTQA